MHFGTNEGNALYPLIVIHRYSGFSRQTTFKVCHRTYFHFYYISFQIRGTITVPTIISDSSGFCASYTSINSIRYQCSCVRTFVELDRLGWTKRRRGYMVASQFLERQKRDCICDFGPFWWVRRIELPLAQALHIVSISASVKWNSRSN